jgi:quercetin dioxygenase-like cupin family protein
MNSPSLLRRCVEWALALVIGIAIGVLGMHFRQSGRQPVQAAQLLHSDLTGVPGKEVFMTIIEVKPGAAVAAHLHNGDEFVYVLEGSYERFVEQAHTVSSAGEAFSIEREKVHGGKAIGEGPAKLLAVHVVDKGKPFAEHAK